MTDIAVVRNGTILEVTIARGKANAIDAATSNRMSEAFLELRDDPTLRVGILTGAGGRFFTAGWDLKAAAEGEEYETDYGPGGFGGFAELPDLNKPVICAVNGMAVGGGFEMCMAAHLVVAAEHAEFFLPEAAVGIIPDVGSILLPRRLPRQLANEVLFAGRRLSAAEAMQHGLVNAVVPTDQLMTEARALAERIVTMAPLAVTAIIDVVRQTEGLVTKAAFDHLRSGNLATYETMLMSKDAQEGPTAFAEKRPPIWTAT